VRSDLPPSLTTVVHRTMGFVRAERFTSVDALSLALEQVVNGRISEISVAPTEPLPIKKQEPPSAVGSSRENTAPPVSNTNPSQAVLAVSGRPITAFGTRKAVLLGAGVGVFALASASALLLSPWSRRTAPVESAAGSATHGAVGERASEPMATRETAVEARALAVAPIASAAPTAIQMAALVPSSKPPSVFTPPHHNPSPQPAPKPAPPPVAAPKNSCDPNFALDAQGEKHFKPECFK
jgi:hypothetical protein